MRFYPKACCHFCTLTLNYLKRLYFRMTMVVSFRFFTVRNEVAKVIFSQACVCPQGGFYLSGCWDTNPQEPDTPPGPDTLQGQTPPWDQTPPPEQTPSRSRHHSPQEQTPSPPQDQTPPPPPERQLLLRRHASYWYAYLFIQSTKIFNFL